MLYEKLLYKLVDKVINTRIKQDHEEGVAFIRINVQIQHQLLEMREVVMNLLKFKYNITLERISKLEVTYQREIVFDTYLLHLSGKQFILYQDAQQAISANETESSSNGTANIVGFEETCARRIASGSKIQKR